MANLVATVKIAARVLTVGVLAGAVVAGLGGGAAQAATTSSVKASAVTVRAAGPFYVSGSTPSAKALAATRSPSLRRALAKIAGRSQAQWVAGSWVPTSTARGYMSKLTAGARATNTVLPLVIYNIPHRDCGLYSSGGAASPAAYKAWVNQVAAGIGATKTMVILEPDALGQLGQAGCLTPAQQAERLGLLRWAGARLAAQPKTLVYLDAGNANWQSAATMAARLRAAGVNRVRGFALNVAGTDYTAHEAGYGQAISALTGGAHYVIDTSRSGNGPLAHQWCNPAGRALGEAPTLRPAGYPGADALLWIKTIGVSDGTCHPGDAPAGTYMPSYAAALATRAHW